jgi:hypothetical protein
MRLFLSQKLIALTVMLVSTLVASCKPPSSTNSSTETLTVYEAAPTLTPLDLGSPGKSPGDAYYFSAQLYSSPGGRMIGEVFGSKTLMKIAGQANPDSEKRATLLFFTFNRGQDQIIALGATDYPPTAAEFGAGQPVSRAILSGTGRYMGVRGQLTSTRNADGTYKQEFTLLK